MTQQTRRIHEALEAQRWIASQASREQDRAALVANTLERAGELALAGYYRESKAILVREMESN